jgi:branched-chain amino acid transport system substrate-binding protein
MQRRAIATAVVAALIALFVGSKSSRAADDTIKIGYIDPLSGSFAQEADEDLQALHYILDYVNASETPLGKKFELVTFDDKFQPADALVALKQVIGQNMPIVMTQYGSHIAATMIDAVAKNNQTNPEHRVLYLNAGSQATELTNEKCNFWHFRFAPNVEQITYTRIKSLPADLKKVYLLNQDFLYGRSVEHDTKRLLRELRPDIEIVGDEFVPLLQVKDFSPYINKIKQSGAQSLLTGNFGDDLIPGPADRDSLGDSPTRA